MLESAFEHRERIIVGFFILRYAKLRKLELYQNFCDNFFGVGMILGRKTKEILYVCIHPDMRTIWEKMRENDSETLSGQMQNQISSSNVLQYPKKLDLRNPGLFKEEFRYTEMLCLCSKMIDTLTTSQIESNSSKGLIKQVLEDSGDNHVKAQKITATRKQPTSHLQAEDF